MEPARFDEMRRGLLGHPTPASRTWTSTGSRASLCFPSLIAGFAGTVFARIVGPRARPGVRPGVERLACTRSGPGTHPGRLHRQSSSVAARPGGRGRRGPRERRARASGRSRSPRTRSSSGCRRSTPSTGTRCCAACEETGTVVCLHTGVAQLDRRCRRPGAPLELLTTLFPGERDASPRPTGCGPASCTRFPRPRHRDVRGRHRLGADAGRPDRLRARPLGERARRRARWPDDLSPSEVLRAQLLVLHDRRSELDARVRDHIGVDHIMIEADYPHADSTLARHPGPRTTRPRGRLPDDEVAARSRAANAERRCSESVPSAA